MRPSFLSLAIWSTWLNRNNFEKQTAPSIHFLRPNGVCGAPKHLRLPRVPEVLCQRFRVARNVGAFFSIAITVAFGEEHANYFATKYLLRVWPVKYFEVGIQEPVRVRLQRARASDLYNRSRMTLPHPFEEFGVAKHDPRRREF